MPTINQILTNKATSGILKFQLIYFDKHQETIGKKDTLNMIIEACNDDEIANIIMEYHKDKMEE